MSQHVGLCFLKQDNYASFGCSLFVRPGQLSAEFLTSLVKGLLFGFNEGDKDKKNAERRRRQEDSRSQCNSLVLSLIEM